MVKTVAKRQSVVRPGGFALGGRPGDFDDIEERLKKKKLPDHVREEIGKEMRRMGGETQSSVTLKYI
jgi:phosphoribosylformylglycinamidine (FGAM) synthase-like amidotransferase family enzyme